MRHLRWLVLVLLFACDPTVEGLEQRMHVDPFTGEEVLVEKGDGSCNCAVSFDDDCEYEYSFPMESCFVEDDYIDDVDIKFNGALESYYGSANVYCGFDTPQEYYDTGTVSIKAYGDAEHYTVTVAAWYANVNGPAYGAGTCYLFGSNSTCNINNINLSTTYPFWGARVYLPWYSSTYDHGIHGFRICYDDD